jgi:hypothetical protein
MWGLLCGIVKPSCEFQFRIKQHSPTPITKAFIGKNLKNSPKKRFMDYFASFRMPTHVGHHIAT